MTIKSKITLALRNFFKKFGKIIFIALLVWIIIFIFNMYLRNLPEQLVATNTYDPDDPVIEYGGRVPENELSSVNETLENYLTYCKNKEYENAFNMLTDDCKNFLYNNNIENFKTYVDSVFTTYNNYSYNQNYSNVNNKYIYDVTILNNDILSTGTTGGYDKYEEKITIVNEDDGTKKISNQGYIDNEEIGIDAEDDNIRVRINSKDMSYTRVGYNLTITNKTDKTIVIADNEASKEVTLNVNGYYQNAINIDSINAVLAPGETKDLQFVFDRFYDSQDNDSAFNFNYIRVLQNYTAGMSLSSQEEQAIRIYSFNISLN